jgi:hypothetical protein
VSLAHALKVAARAVSLYPPEHPAIKASFAGLVHASAMATSEGPFSVTVAPDALTVAGRPLPRPDAATAELAGILHQHLIGQLTIEPGAGDDTCVNSSISDSFPERLRAEWHRAPGRRAAGTMSTSAAGLQEILRDKDGGPEATWDRIIAEEPRYEQSNSTTRRSRTCRDGRRSGSPGRHGAHAEALVTRPADMRAHATVLLRVLTRVLSFVNERDPDRLSAILDNMASALCRLSDNFVSPLVVPHEDPVQGAEGPEFMKQIIGRMRPEMIAQFAARSIAAHRGTARAGCCASSPRRKGGRRCVTRAELEKNPRRRADEELWGGLGTAQNNRTSPTRQHTMGADT